MTTVSDLDIDNEKKREVIEVFVEVRDWLKMTEVADRVSMSYRTVNNLVHELNDEGYLRWRWNYRNPGHKQYRVGFE